MAQEVLCCATSKAPIFSRPFSCHEIPNRISPFFFPSHPVYFQCRKLFVWVDSFTLSHFPLFDVRLRGFSFPLPFPPFSFLFIVLILLFVVELLFSIFFLSQTTSPFVPSLLSAVLPCVYLPNPPKNSAVNAPLPFLPRLVIGRRQRSFLSLTAQYPCFSNYPLSSRRFAQQQISFSFKSPPSSLNEGHILHGLFPFPLILV